MLLMQHAELTCEDSPLCWSSHAKIFDVIPLNAFDLQSDMALFIGTKLILARTAQTTSQLQTTRFHALEKPSWLECASSSEAQKICETLALSPQLSFLIFSVTSLAIEGSADRLLNARVLEAHLTSIHQRTEELELAKQEVILKTAEAFRFAAIMYLRTRIYG
jgi:hypothetical protein